MRRPNYWLDLTPAERAEWRARTVRWRTIEGFCIALLIVFPFALAASWVVTWLWLALGLP